MLEISMCEARDQLIRRIKSVRQVPELPAELFEELDEVVWCLIMHYERISRQASLIEEIRDEVVHL